MEEIKPELTARQKAARTRRTDMSIKRVPEETTPTRKAIIHAKIARIMTKWLITYNRSRTGAKWKLVEFGGPSGSEARGIVDMVAIRKDHRHSRLGLKRGDLFDIILIQTKGGFARRPTPDDVARLSRVAKYHRAKAVVLSEWRRGEKLVLFELNGANWRSVSPHEIFS